MLACAGLLFTAAMTLSAQPVNDDFAARSFHVESGITVTGTLANASAEIGEPLTPGISSGQTAWWTWTSPSNGIVNLSVSGTGFNPFAAVYTGSTLETLDLIATNSHFISYENSTCGSHLRTRSQMIFHVSQGQSYHISLDSALLTESILAYPPIDFDNPNPSYPEFVRTTNVIPGAALTFNLNLTPAPRNDDLAHAKKLSGNRVHATASNVGATREPGEPFHLGNSGGSSVWYSWTAPVSGRATISTNYIPPYQATGWDWTYGFSVTTTINLVGPPCGDEIDQEPLPEFYPVFSVYTGDSIATLLSANAFLLDNTDDPHAVAFDVIKGETYRIAFDGNQGTTGIVPLSMSVTKPASNDDFKKRIATHGIYVEGFGFNAGATREPGEALTSTNTSGKSVWWSWTAPVSGIVEIELEEDESDAQFPIAVLTGTSLSTLSLISTGQGSTSFETVAGEKYQIAISDLDGVTGKILFHIEAPVVAAELNNVISSRKSAVLNFTALKGQKLLLQKSMNGSQWQNVRTTVAHNKGASFRVNPPPSENGPFYRAIIVDYRR